MGSNRNRETTFRFKQFVVDNSQSAMKVGTDGVLLGAWTAIPIGACRVLDVGCGTGLISLMVAQRNPGAVITAIDINADAVEEARRNVAASPFGRIEVQLSDYRRFESDRKFDLIICNPPFFTETLHSPDSNRAAARHEDSLPTHDLMCRSAELLADTGTLAIIAPTLNNGNIELEAALAGLHPVRRCHVTTTPIKPPKRTLWQFSKIAAPLSVETLQIKDLSSNYTEEYKQLVEDFYIKL